MNTAARFIRSLRLTGIHCEILTRMSEGDDLRFYDSGRLILHTSSPDKRSSLDLNPRTLTSLSNKGVIEPDSDRSERQCQAYKLTEDGETAARILRRVDLPPALSKTKERKYQKPKVRNLSGVSANALPWAHRRVQRHYR